LTREVPDVFFSAANLLISMTFAAKRLSREGAFFGSTTRVSAGGVVESWCTRKRGEERAGAERSAPIKNPDGFNRNVAFGCGEQCGYSCGARGCDAPGSNKSKTKEAILDGRKKHH
jgi:hypothetical protein